MKRKFYLLLIWLLVAAGSNAQVTIGSNAEPVKGAILDLKSQVADDDNVTSTTGGLLLPRVQLETETSVALFFGGTDQSADVKKLLTGLTVYNLTSTSGFSAGPYNWDGTKWVTFGGAGGTAYTGDAPIDISGTLISLNDAGVTTGKLADNAVTSDKILNGTILAADLNDMGATNGQVLKYSGSAWAPADDAGGTVYTADNGVTMASNNVELGGTLTKHTYITNGVYELVLGNGGSGLTNVQGGFRYGNSGQTKEPGMVLTTDDIHGTASWQKPKSSVINGQVIAAGSSAVVMQNGPGPVGMIASGSGIRLEHTSFTTVNPATYTVKTYVYNGYDTGQRTDDTVGRHCYHTIHAITDTTIGDGWTVAPY